ncbi:formate dehydrogenase subunit delta [uncultured Sphaerotilus sp.]|uniref:formate dehydrogenase subunit delta n=1 Tax=uncultured Sphaerotilus sp. TaxID=474984 RepID=UPI0030CA414D
MSAPGQDQSHSHDPDQTIVRLANRIGDFFEAFPDRDEAIEGVASHIRKFWEPRMRRQLYAYLDGPQAGAGLNELVLVAVRARRTALRPDT